MSFLIQGRGLAAALTVDALLNEGISATEIWVKGELTPPAGSLAPAALLNPLTGRSLKPPAEGPEPFEIAQASWARLQNTYPETIHSKVVHRPFIQGRKLFEKLHKTFLENQGELEAGWGARLATTSELNLLRDATVPTCIGAMTIEGCYAVELENFLGAFWQSMVQNGLHHSGNPANPSTVIRCDGASLNATLPSDIQLEPLGGELFEIEPIAGLPSHFALAGDGHYIGIDETRAIIGSTYHRHGQPLETRPWDHLKSRMEHWLPSVNGTPMKTWYGER